MSEGHYNQGRATALNEAMRLLTEQFDNVQLFVNSHEDGMTYASVMGTGNTFARVAQVERWLALMDEGGDL